VSQKTAHFVIFYIFANYEPIFKIFFTGAYCGQLATKQLLNIPPNFYCVVTLPCET